MSDHLKPIFQTQGTLIGARAEGAGHFAKIETSALKPPIEIYITPNEFLTLRNGDVFKITFECIARASEEPK